MRGPASATVLAALLAFSCGPQTPSSRPCTLAIEAPEGAVGFGARVRLIAHVRCSDDVPPPSVVWDDGTRGAERVVVTPTAEAALRPGDRPGVLAVSPAQGRIRVSASAGGASASAEVIAAPIASGLAVVPTGAPIYVHGGPGGRIQRVVPADDGRLEVRDEATGFEMALSAGRPDDLPRDCQRPECHPSESAGHAPTRHATTMDRALLDPPRGYDPACLRCHTDGGDALVPGSFVDVARSVGFWPIPRRRIDPGELPPTLKRLAGVGCVACHGPAALPDPPLRPAVYAAGVCAQCHDDPPRYQQTAEWRASRMSMRRPFAADPECSGCHSAQGFVKRLGSTQWARVDTATVEPVTCAACHDSHGPDAGRPHQLRLSSGKAGAGGLCLACHRTDLDVDPARRRALRLAPMASQAALAPQDCVRCHRAHTFRALVPADDGGTAAARLRAQLARAKEALRSEIGPLRGCNRAAGPAHTVGVVWDRVAVVDAKGNALGDCNADGRFGDREDPLISAGLADRIYRRAFDLLLVERDRGAAYHDAAGAERLLAGAAKPEGAP